MGSNLMNEHNFKQLLVLEVCHWPWTNIYHEHNLSSWYGKGIHLLYSCKFSLQVVMFVVLLDFLWIFFSRQKEGPASMILLEPAIRGCSSVTLVVSIKGISRPIFNPLLCYSNLGLATCFLCKNKNWDFFITLSLL